MAEITDRDDRALLADGGRAGGPPRLRGREGELRRVRLLIDAARGGRSGVLAVVGEAGIGKTAVLEAAAAMAAADGVTLLRARGTEGEAELPFSGLHELFGSALPPAMLPSQLRDVFAGRPRTGADRFSVYVATLDAFAIAAGDGPVVALVDDVQWLDEASAQALRFVGRRLGHEGVALLLAGRVPPDPLGRVGIPSLHLAGLDMSDSRALVADASGRVPAPEVLAALVAGCGGNPLALEAAAEALEPAQLMGAAPLPDPPLVGPAAADLFAPAVAALPEPSRGALMLVAAAGRDVAPAVLGRALEGLGLAVSDLEPAESAGLIRLDAARAEFRHPLVRSAAYHAADPAARRAAHRALADSLPKDLAEARAWHLAAAAIGPDAAAGDALAAAAIAQRDRGGHAAASRAFARAAALTDKEPVRSERLLHAARAARLAGRDAAALELVDGALESTRSAIVRAGLQSVRAAVQADRGQLRAARELLMSEADAVEIFDRRTAMSMLVSAALPGLWSGEVDPAVVPARQAYALARALGSTDRAEPATTLALIVLGREEEARPALSRWCERVRGAQPLDDPGTTLALARVLTWTERWTSARDVLRRFIAAARARAPGALPLALEVLADLEWRAGRWGPGLSAAAEGVELAEQMDQSLALMRCLAVRARYDAAMGQEEQCRAALSRLRGIVTEVPGETWVEGLAESPEGLMALARGDGRTAADVLGRAMAAADRRGVREPGALLHLGDLIEAELMTGRPDAARAALAALERRTAGVERPSATATALRCSGMLAEDGAWEERLATAALLHERASAPFERARDLLALGERLRRARRRAEARAPLRDALAVFENLGADPWSRRTRSELRATGGRVAGRRGAPSSDLTPQELRVALAVADGASNREAAAALFLSPKTIEHHLTSVYGKLGVRSRTALARRLLTPPSGAIGESPMRTGPSSP